MRAGLALTLIVIAIIAAIFYDRWHVVSGDPDAIARLAYMGGWGVLVGAGVLAIARQDLGATIRMILAWLIIFTIVALGYNAYQTWSRSQSAPAIGPTDDFI